MQYPLEGDCQQLRTQQTQQSRRTDVCCKQGEAARAEALAKARSSQEEQERHDLDAALRREVTQTASLQRQLRQAQQAQVTLAQPLPATPCAGPAAQADMP